MGLAKFEIIGRLTRDPEEKKTQSGTTVGKFGVAVNRRNDTDFWNVTTFGKTAEFCIKWLHKGSSVRLYGDMKNKRDGNTTYYDFIADDVTFMDTAKKQEDSFPETDEESPF